MGRANDDKWLDEALTGALGADDTQPNFEQWKTRHPEAVQQLTTRTPQSQRPPTIGRFKMKSLHVKLAAAAVIALAAIVGMPPL